MGFYDDQIVPRMINLVCGMSQLLPIRERVTSALQGDVLEIGFGSGLNLPYYGSDVTKIYAVDPSATGKKLASKRITACKIPLEWSGLDGQRLALPDASVDAVLSTFTFCTIPDLAAALAEARRVLRPNGTLHFLEHGRSPDAGVAKWQDRLNPLQQRMCGGCNLNRSIDKHVQDAGFRIETLQTYYLPGPKFAAHMFEGRAVIA